MVRAVTFFLLMLPVTALGQFTYRLDQDIPIKNDPGEDLRLAWAGGLNAAQFNAMDLNEDGNDDLVLYDRMASKIITFLAAENNYVAAPQYEELFPEGVYNWLLLRDYNCDGRKDVFTGDVLGIKVYKNITTIPGELKWEQHLFQTGFGGTASAVLLTENPATKIKVNLQLQFDDLPSISDVDGDGDLDIMNIQYAGHTVEFHRNLSAEKNLPCDSLEYMRVTRSWGNVKECYCGEFTFDGEDCPPTAGGRTKHSGGKSLLAIDLDGDQAQDLLFSEAECNQLFALSNKGSSVDPVIDNFTAFPQNNPVNFVVFPAAYYEDVDFDGKKDLIATPNIFSKEFFNSDLNKSTWLYKNTGSNSAPSFSFVQPDFLQSEMIDVGDNAVPAFADYDGDGDFDMLISSHSSDDFTSRVYLYENTGSISTPAFQLVSDDYLGFSTSRFYNVKIHITDINSDQTNDLLFSATNFDTGVTRIYFLNNNSQTSLDFNGATLQVLDFALTSSENVYFSDVNTDGLSDILAGRSEGNLEYWRNNGIAGSPSFLLEDESFLGLGSSPLRQDLATAIADLDNDGRADIIIADQTGRPGIVSDFRNAESAENEVVNDILFNQALSTYVAKNLGGRTWPAVVNLYNTNKPAVVFGNTLGGIHILKHDDGSSLPEIPQIHIYPNPALNDDVVHVQADRTGTMEIFSVIGKRLGKPVVLNGNEVYRYALPPLASGLYLLKFTANDKSNTKRFVIR